MTDFSYQYHFYKNLYQICCELTCGAVAGCIGVVVGVPFDFVKVRLQTFPHLYTSAWHCLSLSIRHEGVFGLYRGLLAPITAQGGVNALMFAGESITMKFLEPNLKPNETGKPWNTFIAGSCGGFIQCFVLVPSDVIKCHLQVDNIANHGNSINTTQKYNGMIDCASKIYSSQGLKGLYKGFDATVLREIPSIGTYFSIYRYTKEFLTPSGQESSSLVTMFSGALAGSCSWGIVYPLDVIKSNMQVDMESSLSKPKHVLQRPQTSLQMAKYLYSKHGIKIFFNGFGTTVTRAIPVNATTFYFYEYFRKLMNV